MIDLEKRVKQQVIIERMYIMGGYDMTSELKKL